MVVKTGRDPFIDDIAITLKIILSGSGITNIEAKKKKKTKTMTKFV